eukprot:890884-Amphidinium_carterae.1
MSYVDLYIVTQKGVWGSQKTARLYLADASCERVLQALSHQQRLKVVEYGKLQSRTGLLWLHSGA